MAFIDFHISIKDTRDNLLDSLSWRAGNRIARLSALDRGGFLITDMIADIIPSGDYRVDLDASHNGQTGRATFGMNVPSFKAAGPRLSSIEFAYEIKPDSGGRFVKNGYRVMPNPSGQFYQENRTASVYAEAYGLDTSAGAESLFFAALEILSPDSQVITKLQRISYLKPGPSAVIAANFPIDSLSSGEFVLRLTVSDGADSVSTAKDFSVVVSREAMKRTILQGILRDFPEATQITSESDADKFREEIAFIATHDELKLFDSLNLTGKESFQKDFWARRDPDPSTPVNEFQIEHYKRFKYVETTYGRFQGGVHGWRTDRGRVYMVYGEPSEIERFPQTLDARSWERWWYHGLEGGVYFIFVDYEDAGDYTLIHSSKRDEVKNYNWEDRIKVGDLSR